MMCSQLTATTFPRGPVPLFGQSPVELALEPVDVGRRVAAMRLRGAATAGRRGTLCLAGTSEARDRGPFPLLSPALPRVLRMDRLGPEIWVYGG
jgi:hypothetical protein